MDGNVKNKVIKRENILIGFVNMYKQMKDKRILFIYTFIISFPIFSQFIEIYS